MSTSDRRHDGQAVLPLGGGGVRTVLALGVVAAAATGITGIVMNAHPALTLTAGLATGMLYMAWRRAGGGDA